MKINYYSTKKERILALFSFFLDHLLLFYSQLMTNYETIKKMKTTTGNGNHDGQFFFVVSSVDHCINLPVSIEYDNKQSKKKYLN